MGLITGIFFFLFKDKPDFELPLEEIKVFKRGKQGINKNVIRLTDHSGTEYKLIYRKFDHWMGGFQQALEQLSGHKLVLVEAQSWEVKVSAHAQRHKKTPGWAGVF